MPTESVEVTAGAPRTWRRFKFPQSLIKYMILLLILVFVTISIEYLNVHLSRFADMFGRLWALFSKRYYPPDIPYILDSEYLGYVVETVKMAYLGALFGILLAIPLSWFASFNMSPNRRYLYPISRLILMLCRSVHEMIWTILFVTILGFGMLPGVLALAHGFKEVGNQQFTNAYTAAASDYPRAYAFGMAMMVTIITGPNNPSSIQMMP